MLLNCFKLRDQPFGVTLDPRFLFATNTHREALASLLYGLNSGVGFIALIARPGMGKTTLLFETLRRIEPTSRTVFLVQSIPTPVALLQVILADLQVPSPQSSLVDLQRHLNDKLIDLQATGKQLIVIIDEAQNLSHDVLEAVRMLSNFETARRKLIQIILSGQPSLAETLRLPHLLQLSQRISIFATLEPLSAREIAPYIEHRLQIAGCPEPASLFMPSAIRLIAESSQGIPRNINKICFNALTIACALKKRVVEEDIVIEALLDCGLADRPAPAGRPRNVRFSMQGHRGYGTRNRKPQIVAWPGSQKAGWPLPKLVLTAFAASVVVAIFSWLAVADYRAIAADDDPALSISNPLPALNEFPSQSNPASSLVPKQRTVLAVPRMQSENSECAATGLTEGCKQFEQAKQVERVEQGALKQ